MGSYNQFHPTVLGMEFPPVVQDPVLLDTATSVGYRFTPVNRNDVQVARILTVDPLPGQALRKCLSADIYPVDGAPSTGVIRTMLIPVASGTLGSGAANSGGSTVADCVRNPSDTWYTSLTGASASVRLWFDVTASRVSRALTNARILDVTVRYAATGPFDTLANGLVLALERPSASVVFDMDDALTGPSNQYDNVVAHRSRLGDLNPFWASNKTPNTDYERAPYRYAAGVANHVGLTQLAASGGTNVNVQFRTSADAAGLEWRIQYAALEITYCVESRVAAGGLELTPGATLLNDLFVYDVNVGSLTGWGLEGVILQGYYYDVVVGQGFCGALSVAHPVPLELPRVSAGQVYGPHEGIVIRKSLRDGESWTAETTDAVPAVVLYSEQVGPADIVTGSQVYVDQVVATVDADVTTSELQARIVDDQAATYPYVRFYARVQEATAAELTVVQVQSGGTLVGPSATITVDQLLDLEEITDGWRRVTLAWDTAVVTTGAGLVYISFTTLADSGGPWEILGADANPADVADQDIADATYGGDTARALIDSVEDYTADLTVMLVQAMPVISGLTAGTAVQPLSLVDESCDLPIAAIPTGITYVTLTWDPDNSAAVAGFAYYQIQRRDTTMPADTWETIAAVTDVTQGAASDYEARIGVTSTYRARFVHVDGYTGDWSSTVTATVTAPGVTGTGITSVLVLTSNYGPDANAAHAMAWDSGIPGQDFGFPEGSQTTLQPMYQRDYRVAFRPLERTGVEFSRTLLVNTLGVPPQTLSDGFSGLRDLAWDILPYVCVRDEQGNRWLTAVSVPSGSVRDVPDTGHLMLAQAAFAEVTATPAPVDYSTDCQGLMLTGRDNTLRWQTEVGATILQGVLDAQDTFTRTVAAGSWGAADTGETYTVNTPSGASVNGSKGLLTVAAAATTVSARMSGTRDFYLARNTVTLPAVATGNTYKVSQLFHCVDQITLSDTFTRSVSNGWGTADSGQVWTASVADAPSLSATGTRGRITLGSTGKKEALFDYTLSQWECLIGRLGLNAAVTGASGLVTAYVVMARSTDGTNRVELRIIFGTGVTTTYKVAVVRFGVDVDVSATVDTGLASSVALALRYRVNGYRVQAKVWQNGGSEPGSFLVNEDLSDQPGTGTFFALGAEKNASVTNATMQVEYDDVSAVNTDGFECYRLDAVLKTDGTMTMDIISRVSNLEYVMQTGTISGTYTTNTVLHMSTYFQGYSLEGRIWRDGDPEPGHFGAGAGSLVTADLRQMAVHGGGQFGLRASRDSGNTNSNVAPQFDDLNIYQLPTEFDVRFLIRPVADDWALAWNAYSPDTTAATYVGEWRCELSNSQARMYLGGADAGTLDIDPQPIFKNQKIWVRFNFQTDDGTGLALFSLYTSLDGSSWDLVDTNDDVSPSAPPALPEDDIMEVEAKAPADSVWIYKVEMRADGQLLYDPDFAAQPAGRTSFEDSQDNVWTGEAALCVDQ